MMEWKGRYEEVMVMTVVKRQAGELYRTDIRGRETDERRPRDVN
jgi:hypothetical protein